MPTKLSFFGTLCGNIAKVSSRGIGFAVGGPAGAFVAGLVVDSLVDAAESEQELAAIEAKIDRLIGMHYRAGHKWLLEARNQRILSVKQQYIQNAMGAFVNAVSIADLPLNAARAETYIGVCHGLLNRPDLPNYEAAYKLCLRIEDDAVTPKMGIVCFARGYETKMYTRRGIVEATTRALMASDSSGYGIIRTPTELYEQLGPIAELLRARKSSLLNLRPAYTYDRNGFSNLFVDYVERTCKVKYPLP